MTSLLRHACSILIVVRDYQFIETGHYFLCSVSALYHCSLLMNKNCVLNLHCLSKDCGFIVNKNWSDPSSIN